MSECVLQNSGGIADLDVITTSAADIRKGKVSVDKEGEPMVGSMPENPSPTVSLNCGQSKVIPAGWNPGGTVTANSLASQTGGATATDERVYNGLTYYKDGVKRTGKAVCNSIINFSATAYSTSQILLKWQTPYVVSGRGYGGVRINYSTSGYPGNSGTKIYQGVGDNTTPGGWSSVIVNMPASGVTYYFSALSFVTFSVDGKWAFDIWGTTLNASAATTAHGRVVFTTSGTFTVPAGVRVINVHGVGSGGQGGTSFTTDTYRGSGGGGGYSKWINGIAVTPGESLAYEIGDSANAVWSDYVQSGSTKLLRGNTILLEALGGFGGDSAASSRRPNGGSGGGGARKGLGSGDRIGGTGGSDGSDGHSDSYWFYSGTGQHFTTREYGTGTLFSGGGGGAASAGSYPQGVGGAGGGGGAGANPGSGSAGSGGGGGGTYRVGVPGARGGSGTLVITW